MSASTSTVAKLDTKAIIKMDPYLEPNLPGIEKRWELFAKWKATIDSTEGGYEKFSRGYERFGLQAYDDGTITYREWAPNAVKANLVGDFSKWIVRVSRDFCRLTQNFRYQRRLESLVSSDGTRPVWGLEYHHPA